MGYDKAAQPLKLTVSKICLSVCMKASWNVRLTMIFIAQEAQESQDLQDWWGLRVPKEPEGKLDWGEKWGSWDHQVGQGSQV